MADSIFSPTSGGTSTASAKPSIFSSSPAPAPVSPSAKSTPSPYVGPYAASYYSPAVNQAVEKVQPSVLDKIKSVVAAPLDLAESGLESIFGKPSNYTVPGAPSKSPALEGTIITGPSTDDINKSIKDLQTAKTKIDPQDEKSVENYNAQLAKIQSDISQYNTAQEAQKVLSQDYVPTPFDTPGKILSSDLSNVFNEPIEAAGEALGSTKVFQNFAKGSDAGKFLPSFTEELAKRLQTGTEAISGATGGLVQPTMRDLPDDPSSKLLSVLSQGIGMASTLGGLEGSVFEGAAAPKVILDNFQDYPKVQELFNSLAKSLPAFATYGQLNPNLDGIGDRLKTLGTDIATAIPFTALGLIDNKNLVVPVSAALGFGMAKLSGASNKDAAISATALGLLSLVGHPGETSKEIVTQKQAKGQLYDQALETINKFSDTKLGDNPSTDEIKSAFKNAALKTHPDMGGDGKDFSAVTYARDVLLGETKTTEAKVTKTQTPEDMKADIQKTAEEIKNPTVPEESKYKGDIQDLGLNFKKKVPEQEITSPEKPSIVPTQDFRTFDFHELEGQPQTPAENAKIHNNIVNAPEKPMVPGGESFNAAASRAMSAIKDIMTEQKGNVAITTHNSMFGLIKLWSESGQPATLDKSFREKYTTQDNTNPTGSSFVINTPKGDIYVVRHGETEDNAKGVFRTSDTTLTDKGRAQAQDLANELKGKDITKIYSSDLPRAIETSEIIQKGISPLDSIFNLKDNEEYGKGSEEGTSKIQQSSRSVSDGSKGTESADTGSGKRLGYSQDSKVFQGQLSEDLRRSGGTDTVSPKITREVARGVPLPVDNDTYGILKAFGFSPDFIEGIKVQFSKGGFSRISVSNRYKNGGGYYAIFDTKNNVLVVNPDDAQSLKYTDGSILRHEIMGHSWFAKLSPEGRKSFYENLKQNIPLIKEAWESELETHPSFYWNETAFQIYNSIWKANSKDVADRIFKDFQLESDKNISLDEFINRTINIDKKIAAINKELERLGENTIDLKAEDTAGVTEHVATIAEHANTLIPPDDAMLTNYINDVKSGTLRYGSNAEQDLALNFRQKTQDIDQLNKMLEREEESLKVAESNPEQHARIYGPERIDQYKVKIAELKDRIAQAKNPVFNTGNKLEDLRLTLANVEKRVGLENAPVDFKGNNLSELQQTQVELEAMKDAIDNSPLQNLEKYEAKSGIFKGELPEVTGKTLEEIKASKLYGNYKDKNVLKFMQEGDKFIGEAGFSDSEEARAAYQQYKEGKALYKSILRNFTKDVKEYTNFIKQDEKSLEETGKSLPVYLEDIEPPIVRGETQAPKLDFRKWRDIATPRLGRDTFERNIEKVAPKADAEKIKEFIVEPVRENELSRTKFNNELKSSILKKLKDLGIKRNTTEDELIQVFGEGKMSLGELQKIAPQKWQQIESAAGFFRNIYDSLLDTWNKERQKFGYAPIPKVPNYFRHFDEINLFVKNYGFLRSQDELPTEIAGKTEFFKPGKPFSTAEMSRTGDKTKYSAIGGFNNYIESVSKQIFHIDSVQRGRALEKYLENSAKLARQTGDPLKLSNVMANFREYVNNQLAGKTATLDRAIESTIGRPALRGFSSLSKLIGKNIIVGNISTALSHLVTLPLITATTDKIPLVKGAMTTLTAPLKAEPFSVIDGQESSYLVRRFPLEEIMPSMPKTAEKALSYLFIVTDKFKSRLAVSSKYYEGIGKGLAPSQAMEEADIYAGKTIGDYSIGQKPNILNTKTTSLLAQFQLGMNDGLSVLLHDIPEQAKYETTNEKGEKITKRLKWQIMSKLLQFAIFSFLFNLVLKNIRGSGKGLDPIDLGMTLTGLNKEGAGQSFPSRLGLAGKDLAGEIPFTSAFTGNFPLASTINQPIKDLAAGKYAAVAADILSTVGSPIGGGSQAKKTIEGALAIKKGESSGLGQNMKSLVFGASTAVTPNSAISLKLATKLKTQETKLAGFDPSTINRVQPIFDQAKAAGFGTDKADELVSTLSDYEYKVYKAMKSVDAAKETISLESKVLPIVEKAFALGFATPEADKLIADSFPQTPEGDKEYEAYKSVKASFTLKPPTGSVGNNNNGVATFEGHPTYYSGQTGPDASKILGGNPDDGNIKGQNSNGEPLYARDAKLETSRKAEMYKSDPYWKKSGYALGDTQFDHIVPLEAGGTNTANNVMLIPKVADEANQVFEDYLGNLYSSGRISRSDAAKAAIDYKVNKTVSLLDVMRGTY